jgi:response regulator RpfG family c-di-GMP phosphodiesterase
MIDDEDLLLTMGETVLSSYGYRVLTANNGQKRSICSTNVPRKSMS